MPSAKDKYAWLCGADHSSDYGSDYGSDYSSDNSFYDASNFSFDNTTDNSAYTPPAGNAIVPDPFININDDIDDCINDLNLAWPPPSGESYPAPWNPSAGDVILHNYPKNIQEKTEYVWDNWCTNHCGSDFTDHRSNEKGYNETNYDSGYDGNHVRSFDGGDDSSYDSNDDGGYDSNDYGTVRSSN